MSLYEHEDSVTSLVSFITSGKVLESIEVLFRLLLEREISRELPV